MSNFLNDRVLYIIMLILLRRFFFTSPRHVFIADLYYYGASFNDQKTRKMS